MHFKTTLKHIKILFLTVFYGFSFDKFLNEPPKFALFNKTRIKILAKFQRYVYESHLMGIKSFPIKIN